KAGHSIEGTPARFTGADVEQSMIDAIGRSHHHRISRNGLVHLPVLYKALKQDPRLHVVAIDTTNQQYGFEEDLHIQRLADIKALFSGHDPNVLKTVTHGAAPDFITAYRMAMQASLAHRLRPDVPDHLPL